MGIRVGTILFTVLLTSPAGAIQEPPKQPSAEQTEFFESHIRPLLVKRCYECHSGKAAAVKGGLRLDSRHGILGGGDSGAAVVPGDVDASLLIQAVRYEANEMPPAGKMTDREIGLLARWVQMGVPWPHTDAPVASSPTGYDWQAARQHWAWQPLQSVVPPAAEPADRIHGTLDRFVAARLRAAGLRQSQPAAAPLFVRRVFFDLLGIPPEPAELEAWSSKLSVGEGAPLDDEVVGELIDALLQRPEYGERWGRHWLDVARYSDVGGWTQDNRPRPASWQYRDWVVRAFNTDMPYDEFVRQQIVGDLIADETGNRSAAAGTGFFALGPTYSSDGGDPDSVAQARGETLDDRVDTFARAFLGVTLACARCHDHKFDPFPTQDYYSIAGIFNNAREGDKPLVDPSVVNAYHEARKPIDQRRKQIDELRKKASGEKRKLTTGEEQQIERWEQEMRDLEAKAPPKYPFAHSLHEAGKADMHVALRGNLRKKGPLAPRRFPRILAGDQRPHFSEGSGRRQLADAVTRPTNALATRVIVNRIWMHHFGAALVRTPNNFGTLGEKPTHPDLLEWLSARFIASGYSVKSLHRDIMKSATYRSSSEFDAEAWEKDGDNRLLWRMSPRRMDVETWRDSVLSVTGELDSKRGGPAVDDIVGSTRRTLYAKISRNAPGRSDTFLRLFDFPIPRASAAQRTSNVVPQQYLFMMNSPFMLARAKKLAARLQSEAEDTHTQIRNAYSRLYGRRPTENETAAALEYLQGESETVNDQTRWDLYCQVLLSANEFMYIR